MDDIVQKWLNDLNSFLCWFRCMHFFCWLEGRGSSVVHIRAYLPSRALVLELIKSRGLEEEIMPFVMMNLNRSREKDRFLEGVLANFG